MTDPMAKTVHIVLLRAIGPETHKIMTMKELEARCHNVGLRHTRNLLATGNLVTVSAWEPEKVRATVGRILKGAGLSNTVLIRSAEALSRIVSVNPLRAAAEAGPSQFQICFLEKRPNEAALAAFRARAAGEKIARVGDDICIDYGGRISDSKLTPALIDRLLQTAGTARNWNTVLKLKALAEAMAADN